MCGQYCLERGGDDDDDEAFFGVDDDDDGRDGDGGGSECYCADGFKLAANKMSCVVETGGWAVA